MSQTGASQSAAKIYRLTRQGAINTYGPAPSIASVLLILAIALALIAGGLAGSYGATEGTAGITSGLVFGAISGLLVKRELSG